MRRGVGAGPRCQVLAVGGREIGQKTAWSLAGLEDEISPNNPPRLQEEGSGRSVRHYKPATNWQGEETIPA